MAVGMIKKRNPANNDNKKSLDVFAGEAKQRSNENEGVVESLKIITRAKTERIARFAFDFAVKNNRKKVTIIHKANIM